MTTATLTRITDWRTDVHLSETARAQLADYITYHEVSLRTLAKAVGCSKSTIWNLTSGHRKTCNPELARRIEDYFKVPRGRLFVPRSAVSSGAVGRKASA